MALRTRSKVYTGGIDSFDSYSYSGNREHTYGIKAVCPEGVPEMNSAAPPHTHLSADEKDTVRGTVRQNITALAAAYPDITFFYFLTPYSALWWLDQVNNGTVYKQIEAEKLAVEQILPYKNIKLFSFNNLTEITTNMNHYKDKTHYAPWVNSLMLEYMHDGKCELTYDNYEAYLDRELEFYTTFDYASLNDQADYADDYYAETLMKQGILGVMPEGN